MSGGQYRLRPLYYVSGRDKAWYKERYGIRYSDAYEIYGLTRTGCCGCPISYKAVEDLERIRPYEPNIVRAAWNIFGKSYEYRKKYNEYKAARKEADRKKRKAGKAVWRDRWNCLILWNISLAPVCAENGARKRHGLFRKTARLERSRKRQGIRMAAVTEAIAKGGMIAYTVFLENRKRAGENLLKMFRPCARDIERR